MLALLITAPCPLDETQRVLFAAFDARFRFDPRHDVLGVVDYGKGVAPFELVGWTGGLVPVSQTAALGRAEAYTKGRDRSA